MNRLIFVLMIVFMVAFPAVGHTQICWRGKPGPECKGFWLVEFTYANEADGNLGSGHVATTDAGFMYNVTDRNAVGVSLAFGMVWESEHRDESRLGPKIRYRRWLNRSFNLDVAGQLLYVVPREGEPPEYATEFFVNYKSWVGLGARVEFWPERMNHDAQTAVYGAAKVGDVPALAATGIFLGALAVVVIAYASGG